MLARAEENRIERGLQVTARDYQHFADRAQRERDAAASAADPAVAAMHEELAQRYGAVADAFAALDRTRMKQG